MSHLFKNFLAFQGNIVGGFRNMAPLYPYRGTLNHFASVALGAGIAQTV